MVALSQSYALPLAGRVKRSQVAAGFFLGLPFGLALGIGSSSAPFSTELSRPAVKV